MVCSTDGVRWSGGWIWVVRLWQKCKGYYASLCRDGCGRMRRDWDRLGRGQGSAETGRGGQGGRGMVCGDLHLVGPKLINCLSSPNLHARPRGDATPSVEYCMDGHLAQMQWVAPGRRAPFGIVKVWSIPMAPWHGPNPMAGAHPRCPAPATHVLAEELFHEMWLRPSLNHLRVPAYGDEAGAASPGRALQP